MDIAIRQLEPADDVIIVAHYLALWRSYGTPAEDFSPDADASVRRFLREGRAERDLAAFIAEADGVVAGSAACSLHLAPYPNVIRPERRKFGYIWHVYVDPHFRRHGIGRSLTERTIEHLRALNCTKVVLNASDPGEPLYRALGFKPANEFRLDLADPAR